MKEENKNAVSANEVEWTDEQKQAIEDRGRNILVSAGAGAGKTKVMVERIVRLIVEEGYSVNDLLVVTFTNAAAKEMRDRIRGKLKDEYRERSIEGEDTERIRGEIDRLQSASISTFHAFAQKVIAEFFYLIGLEPGFRVLDEAESDVLKNEAMEDLFEELYEEKSDDFLDFMDTYSGEKSDDDARTMVRELYRKIENIPGKFDEAREKAEALDLDIDSVKTSVAYKLLAERMEEVIRDSIELAERAKGILEDAGLEKVTEVITSDIESLGVCREAFSKEGPDKAMELLDGISWKRLQAYGDEREPYADVRDRVSALRDRYKNMVSNFADSYGGDIVESVKLLNHTYRYAMYLIDMTERFHGIYRDLKKDRKVIDFGDMEHYALEILSFDDARDYYRDRFKYIFIDEYQDTNIMQETIIGKIRRDDNLFMVGDIKQSIYRFRLADPELFKERYESYREDDTGKNEVVILNKNFRSRPKVIEEINNIFRDVLYEGDRSQELAAGVDEAGKDLAPETFVIDKSGLDEEPETGEEGEELEEIANEELEAREAALLIKDLVANHGFRYSDIVILMYSFKRSVEGYREVFKEAGIPMFVDDNDGYFDTIEINVFLALLNVIDNKYQDIPFISVLRSEIFSFSLEELLTVRKLVGDRRLSYVEAAKKIAESDDMKGELQDKLRRVFNSIRRWQAYQVTMPLQDLIWKLLNETGYYTVAGALPGGKERQANLRLLVDKAGSYASYSQDSLYGFISYIETLKKEKVKVPTATLVNENDDVVRLMTIHHSKGLEFPAVLISEAGRSLAPHYPGKVVYDRRLGIGMRAVAPKAHLYQDTLMYDLIKDKNREDSEKEMIRLYYVAATRAMEVFYVIGTVKDKEKFKVAFESGSGNKTSLFGFADYLPKMNDVDALELKNTPLIGEASGDEDGVEIGGAEKLVSERLSYEYPFSGARDLEAKVTVTELNSESAESHASGSGSDEPNEIDWQPEFIEGKGSLTPSKIGTAYHAVMERLDFGLAKESGASYVSSLISEMRGAGILSSEEADSVDTGKILTFVSSDLGARMRDASGAGKLQREQTFELKEEIDGEDVLAQGIIDAFFEEDGKIVLVDYKTNRIDRSDIEGEHERMRETYGTQIKYYREAIERATGMDVAEAYLYLFGSDEALFMP